jgi:hypothetical protein
VVGWVVAVSCFLGGAGSAFSALTFPQALAQHPIPATATVTDHFIDGFGGDPNVDYRYTVQGRTYTGYGIGGLGGRFALDLHVGDPVAIVYARDSPGASCTCDPAAVPTGCISRLTPSSWRLSSSSSSAWYGSGVPSCVCRTI